MKVYHLLKAEHAKDDLRKGRLKVATIHDLNDPFEALSCSLPTQSDRKQFRRIKNNIHRTYGLLCFSASWSNPVLWSHYGDRHTGICLGFTVPTQCLIKIKYTHKRDDLTPDLIRRTNIHHLLLSRKYRDWAYEEEFRRILPLKSLLKEGDLYFKAFDWEMKLEEIVVGPMCGMTDVDLMSALHPSIGKVRIIKARMAFKSFRIVKNKLGFKATDKRKAQLASPPDRRRWIEKER